MSISKPSVQGVFLSAILCLLGLTLPASAAPFTDHFNGLIADLNTRAIVLSSRTDKAGQKQFKAVQNVLGTLNGKPSTSLATDIEMFGGAAKALKRTFPDDFMPPVSSLSSNLDIALAGLTRDVQSQIDTARTDLNSLAASTCKTKVRATLDDAQLQLDGVNYAPNFASAATLLGKALKTTAKASKSTVKCKSQSGG